MFCECEWTMTGCLHKHLVDVNCDGGANNHKKITRTAQWMRRAGKRKKFFFFSNFCSFYFTFFMSTNGTIARRAHKVTVASRVQNFKFETLLQQSRETMLFESSTVECDYYTQRKCSRRCQRSSSLSSSSSTKFNYSLRTIGNSSNRCFVCLLKLNDVHCDVF